MARELAKKMFMMMGRARSPSFHFISPWFEKKLIHSFACCSVVKGCNRCWTKTENEKRRLTQRFQSYESHRPHLAVICCLTFCSHLFSVQTRGWNYKTLNEFKSVNFTCCWPVMKVHYHNKAIWIRGAAIAQWNRLYLPSCHPRFESQAQDESFYNL